MKERLRWGDTSYTILHNNVVVLNNHKTACYSEFMSRFDRAYDTIRIFDIDCKPTIEYKEWFLQYVIDMFGIEGSFNDQYFEFKSQGNRIKDAVVMSVVRLLWECLGGQDNIDTPNLLFKKLRDEPCPYRDKLKKFCYFYKGILTADQYFAQGHSWRPSSTRIRSKREYIAHTHWTSVNEFFTE